MTKTIDTLVSDIYEVVNGSGGWEATITEYMSSEMSDILKSRLEDERGEREPTLRMSGLGTPCLRKIWYGINSTNATEALHPTARLKFLYGDILEILLISLAMAAGHRVEGCQDELTIRGIKGHRDCVIDGVTVDVKSASPFSFKKFRDGALRSDDPFGYISQLSSYVYAGRDGEVPTHPTRGAFLVIDKVSGALCLDEYDFTAEVESKERDVQHVIDTCSAGTPMPPRGFSAIPDGYKNKAKEFVFNGNEKLGINCSYCERKAECWPGLRTFMYKNFDGYRPAYFTKVVKEPNVLEVT